MTKAEFEALKPGVIIRYESLYAGPINYTVINKKDESIIATMNPWRSTERQILALIPYNEATVVKTNE